MLNWVVPFDRKAVLAAAEGGEPEEKTEFTGALAPAQSAG